MGGQRSHYLTVVLPDGFFILLFVRFFKIKTFPAFTLRSTF